MLKKATTEEVATYNGEMKKQGDERMGQVRLLKQDMFNSGQVMHTLLIPPWSLQCEQNHPIVTRTGFP